MAHTNFPATCHRPIVYSRLCTPAAGSVLVHEDELFVADMLNDRVHVFALLASHVCNLQSGRARCLRVIGGAGRHPGRFKQPRCLAMHFGRLLVAEHSRVQVLSLKGVPLQVLPVPGCMAICGPASDLHGEAAVAFALGARAEAPLVGQGAAGQCQEEGDVAPAGVLHVICAASTQTHPEESRGGGRPRLYSAQDVGSLQERLRGLAVVG